MNKSTQKLVSEFISTPKGKEIYLNIMEALYKNDLSSISGFLLGLLVDIIELRKEIEELKLK